MSKRKPPDVDALLAECSEWLDMERWNFFDGQREQMATKRKPWTDFGRASALRDLQGFHADGYDTTLIIKRSIETGWLGLFPKDEFKRKTGPSRETTVTNLHAVETSDKETAAKALADMKQRAKRGHR